MNKNSARAAGAAVLLAGSLVLVACEKKEIAAQGADTTAEPDKVLYDRAMNDVKTGHETVARFSLQTLLNTYPDSEYVAKAKLAIADSYYKDGTTEGFAQAINEYKDFITFFPYLDEASYAQYRVAMAHFRQMEKPDRDATQVQLAEQELQNYLLKYPQGQQVAEVEQHLREVQEVIAEADYRVAKYYYDKASFKASSARFTEIVDRYPLYSHADEALWMLGQSADKYEVTRKIYAGDYYKRIVRDYPLSPHAQAAKSRLETLGIPVPQPNPEALARAQAEKEHAKDRPGMAKRTLGLFSSGPNVSAAAHSGPPQMNPPGNEGGESLGGGGGKSDIVVGGGGGGGAQIGSSASTTPVKVVTPNEPPSAAGDQASTDANAPTDGSNPDAAKPPAFSDVMPNHADTSNKKKASPEESTSKKKKGFWKIIPF